MYCKEKELTREEKAKKMERIWQLHLNDIDHFEKLFSYPRPLPQSVKRDYDRLHGIQFPGSNEQL